MALSALLLAAAFALQPVGLFHGDETIARDGQAWLALRNGGNGAALVATRVRVRAVNDAVLDAPEETTGREVDVDVPDTRVVLRGAGLRPGPVPRAGGAEVASLGLQPLELKLGSTAYRLVVRCTGPARAASRPCEVVMSHAGRSQVLARTTATMQDDGAVMLGDDAAPSLWFAGDLDRDGRLDLILDTTDHYNVGQPTLFLSSRARAGELVRQAAVHRSTGC
ncbi:hypothetical protein [Lysobacter xanthus]